MLENVGAKVDAIDGATTNRRLWVEFGINGSKNNFKNFFSHPTNETRTIFVLSDAPHLIKNVRNRLHDKKNSKGTQNSFF